MVLPDPGTTARDVIPAAEREAAGSKEQAVTKTTQEQPDKSQVTSGDIQCVSETTQEEKPAGASAPVSCDVTLVTTGSGDQSGGVTGKDQRSTDLVNKDTDSSDVTQPLCVDTSVHQEEPLLQGMTDVAAAESESIDARRASTDSLEVKMKVRGDLVVVGCGSSDSASPSGDSVNSSNNKGRRHSPIITKIYKVPYIWDQWKYTHVNG